MTISELIAELEAVKKLHGDLEVNVYDGSEEGRGWGWIEETILIYPRKGYVGQDKTKPPIAVGIK